MPDEPKHSNQYLLKRFIPYFEPYRRYLALDLFCAGLTTICELALPVIVQQFTDNIASITAKAILGIVIFYIFLRVIDAAANYYMLSGGHMMGAKIETDMRNGLFAHLLELPHSFYDNAKVGQLMSRLTNDLFDISEFSHHLPEELFIAAIKIIGCFILFSFMNIWLALIVFSIVPFMFIATSRSRGRMRAAFAQSRRQIGEINAQAEDSLLGIRVVKSFSNEEIEKEKFDKGAKEFLKIKRKTYRNMALFHTTVRLFDGVMYIIVVAAGAFFMRAGQTTADDFTASLLMVTTLLGSIRRIVEFSEQFNQGMTGIERFVEIMDEKADIKDTPDAAAVESTSGDIEFKNVGFVYPSTDKYVLKGLNLHIKPGGNVAIVGPSGGGKTTLCSLITRFYEASEGEILLDGKNIRDVTLRSLRANIGVVQQDVYLFSGTVRENIAYGRPGASYEEIVEAAKLSGAHEFICALPEKYETYVGERGVKLSGGQKQRISIARVFLKNPPVLILDEATSSLDNESEHLVQKSLEQLASGRTTLTIAHRLTTIRNAEEILVLTEDGIAEQGSHKELIQKNGIYSELYSLYTEKL